MGNDDLDIIKEGVKAGVENALRPLGNLVEKLFGGAAKQIGGAWEDELAIRRQIRRVHLFKKLRAAIDNAGFEPQRIPDNICVPALREALLQDDESLQERWTNLLANAADPRQINPVLPSFSQILKEFTNREARFLDALYKRLSNRKGLSATHLLDGAFTSHDLSSVYVSARLSRRPRLSPLTVGETKEGGSDLQADLNEFAATIDVLVRNRILRESTTPNPIDLSKMGPTSKWVERLPQSLEATATTRFHLTDLGRQFINACQAPGSAHSSDQTEPL